MSTGSAQIKTATQVKKVFQEVLQNYPPIAKSTFKKIYVEEVKNHKKYPDCIAVNLRWGKKSNYDYICCHIEKSKIVFLHNPSLRRIELSNFLLKKQNFLRNVAQMLSEPLHTNSAFRKSYDRTFKLLRTLQDWGILGKNISDIDIISTNYELHSVVTQYFIDDIRSSYSSSVSASYPEAFVKSVIEAVEWWAITWKENNKSLSKKFREVENAISPAIFAIYNSKLKDNFSFNLSDSFQWSKVYDLINQKFVEIPSQLVYSKYPLGGEKLIRLPISTGAAAHFSYKNALLNGLCELIERDSFSLHYLTQTSPKQIDFQKDEWLCTMINKIQKKLNVKITILDFTYDFPAYSVGVVFSDDKIGRISIGLSCNFEIQEAIENALYESYKTYVSLGNFANNNLANSDLGDIASIFKKNKQFWIEKQPLSKVAFLFKGGYIDIAAYKSVGKMSLERKVELLLKVVKKNKYNAFVKRRNFRKPTLYVAKIIVPELLPLPLLFDAPYKKTLRLAAFLQSKKKKFNQIAIPPPFY